MSGVTRHYLKENNFMFTRIVGDVIDEHLIEHVTILNKLTKDIRNLREITDCREITSMEQISVNRTVESSSTEIERPDSILAILITDSPLLFGMARAFQTIAKEKRKEVELFNQYDQAIAWIANDKDEEEVLSQHIQSVINS